MGNAITCHWSCDWCGQEFKKGDYGFKAQFEVKISSVSNYLISYDHDDHKVCINCINKIMNVIET